MMELCFTDVFIATFTGDILRYVVGAGGVYLLINIALVGQEMHGLEG